MEQVSTNNRNGRRAQSLTSGSFLPAGWPGSFNDTRTHIIPRVFDHDYETSFTFCWRRNVLPGVRLNRYLQAWPLEKHVDRRPCFTFTPTTCFLERKSTVNATLAAFLLRSRRTSFRPTRAGNRGRSDYFGSVADWRV